MNTGQQRDSKAAKTRIKTAKNENSTSKGLRKSPKLTSLVLTQHIKHKKKKENTSWTKISPETACPNYVSKYARNTSNFLTTHDFHQSSKNQTRH